MTLSNCPRCGRVFVKGLQPVCGNCLKEVEAEFQKCADFLRRKENRGCNIYQLSEGTGVSENRITQFIREGRLSIKNNPNLAIPCESCGKPIGAGRLCDQCSNRLKREVSSLTDNNEPVHGNPGQQVRGAGGGYQVKEMFKRER